MICDWKIQKEGKIRVFLYYMKKMWNIDIYAIFHKIQWNIKNTANNWDIGRQNKNVDFVENN